MLDKNQNYGLKLINGVFLISGGSGGFAFSISAQSDNFEILALCSAEQKLQKAKATNCEDLEGRNLSTRELQSHNFFKN